MPDPDLAPTIRPEEPRDANRVERVVEDAFGRPAEARLVELLRDTAAPLLSLVAEHAGRVVGHVLFSPVTIAGPTPAPSACGLAPVSVAPAFQGLGLGSALIRAGLAACPAQGWRAVFVLGDPRYYGRFGFVPAAEWGLRYGEPAVEPAFQALELEPGALEDVAGRVHYAPAFEKLA